MDPRHLRFYKDELEYLRESAAEWTRDCSRICARSQHGAALCIPPPLVALLEAGARMRSGPRLGTAGGGCPTSDTCPRRMCNRSNSAPCAKIAV